MVVRELFSRYRTAWLLIIIHSLLVAAVYRSYVHALAGPLYDDPAMLWVWPVIFGFASSLLVEVVHPRYGVPAAVAFCIVGGVQWFVLGTLFDLLLRRQGHRTSTI